MSSSNSPTLPVPFSIVQKGPSVKSTDCSVLRKQLRHVMMQERKWVEMPNLLDQLDQSRRLGLASLSAAEVAPSPQPAWVDRFTSALLESGSPSVSRHQLEHTARTLWHWLPAQDPAALARGDLDNLPRSYAETGGTGRRIQGSLR
jgi:hypothetical protein